MNSGGISLIVNLKKLDPPVLLSKITCYFIELTESVILNDVTICQTCLILMLVKEDWDGVDDELTKANGGRHIGEGCQAIVSP